MDETRDWKATLTVILSSQPKDATDAQLHAAAVGHVVEAAQLSPPDGVTTLQGIALEEIT